MGTFTFKWPHAAEEVYVTGTFDNWSQREKLEKVGDHFEKTVTIPETTEPIYYKFVVDGKWTTDHTAPQANDSLGNENNLLRPEDINKETPPTAEVMSTVTPDATTVGLAKDVPLEKKDAPVEEKTEAPAEEKEDSKANDLPGAFPATPAGDLDKQFSVNPLPATTGAVNPVKLDAGEKVPEGIATNGIHDHVTLDKESYEKSDRIPGGVSAIINSAAPDTSAAALAANVPLEEHEAPKVVKESQEKAHQEAGASGMEDLTGEKVEEKAEVENELLDKVPEAPSTSEGTSGKGTEKSEAGAGPSLVDTVAAGASAAGVTLLAAGLMAKDAIVQAAQSETAQSTAQTATDAAAKAKDTIVASAQSAAQQATDAASSAKDTVVAGSQSAAQQGTDASVAAKDNVVTTTQSAAQQATDVTTSAKDTVVATAASAAETVKAAATDGAAALPEPVKNVLPVSVQEAIPAPPTKEETIEKISPEVPVEVKESIAESGQDPEAAANTAAVEQKSAVESELLKDVKPANAIDEKGEAKPADNVPEEVKESIIDSGNAPEAAASSSAVEHKSAVESELLKEVEAVKPIDEKPKEQTLPTEPANTSVDAKVLDGVKDTLGSADHKPKEASKAEGEPKAAESGPHTDAATPPAVAPQIAKSEPAAEPSTKAAVDEPPKTEAKTEFPTKVTNGAETAAAKPAEAPATPAKPAASATDSTAPSSSKGADSPATAEKKKKHRISSFFNKIKDKVASKDKP